MPEIVVRSADAHSALGKAVCIMAALLAQGEPLTMANIARRLTLPRQTVHRLLRQLETNGLVRRDAVRKYYSVGPRFLKLGLEAIRSAWQSGPVHNILASRNRKRLLYARSLARYMDHTITDPAQLEAQMKKIRSKRYAVNQEKHIAGAVGLAVPIRNSSASVVAGLALHAPLVRMSWTPLRVSTAGYRWRASH